MPTDDWTPITSAPLERDLQLSVVDAGEIHALAFPCRQRASGWINAATQQPVAIEPTHWRPWPES